MRVSSSVTTSCYWWLGKPNFGDLLTPILFSHYTDLHIEWAPIKNADLTCVGSVLDLLTPSWSGTVIGSGVLRPTSAPVLASAKILALRGPLSAALTHAKGDFVFGDLGLLADELVSSVEKKHNLGIVPHWSDEKLEHRSEFKKFNPVVIRPSQNPLDVIRQIGECRKIVSSSLHGVILADAFGIPRRTEMCDRFAREGGDFKFRDYCASIDLPFHVGVTQEANRSKVQDRQHELYDVLRHYERMRMGKHDLP